MRMHLSKLGLGCVLTVVLASAPSAKASINYGNFTGPHVEYVGVTETDTQLPGPTPPFLFGTPALSGDSLDFPNTGFVVSVDDDESELQDGRLAFGLVANDQVNGSIGDTLAFTEGGAWAVGGDDSTFAEESLVVNNLIITGVNGVSINPIVVTPTITFSDTTNGAVTVTTSSDSIKFTADNALANGAWNATAGFNFDAALAANDLRGRVTSITVVLNNSLLGTADPGSNNLAFIDKKFFLISPNPPVPEPASAAVVLLGGLALARRRA